MSVTTKGYQKGAPLPPQKFEQTEQDDDSLIVKPLYEEWLLENPEPTMSAEVFDRVMRLLLVPQRDRSGSFSASAAGYCKRRQELTFLGMPKVQVDTPRGIRIFQNGTYVHLRTQVALLSAGIISDIEHTVISDFNGQSVRATLDGIGVARRGVYQGLRYSLEIKGAMTYSYASQERSETPLEKTRKQVAMQMFLLGYEVSSVLNENKDTQELREFVIERNAEEIRDAKKELKELTSAINRQKLHPMLPECIKGNKTGEYFKCPYGTDDGVCANTRNWPRRS